MYFLSMCFCNVPTIVFKLALRHQSTIKHINKVLIANRGEIACRVIKTAKKLGIQTVAVYSEADKNSLHVSLANEAYLIGPPQAAQSYLASDKLLEVARKSGCQAIHPGYGFLSENVEFAEACQKEGVIFIGPPSTAIRDMGIKSTSKHIMSKAGVPIIEGYHGEDQNVENLKKEASRIGYPIMIKAVRGGGGKGMRIVTHPEKFEEALESAKTESQKAFADTVVLLEKFVEEPRHVEVQVFADTHGNAVYLYERDCSVQRRHQKIIEEAPAPGLSWDLRNQLGMAAVRAAKAVGYVGAGTVEFILDRQNLNFHFMEMNTRLQVEHPITEMITGVDLVEWQIKIASGEELPLKQEQIPLKGHSFEARVYAENPSEGFLPGAGQLDYLNPPQVAEDVRVETGVRQGDEVSVHYDPMIAKLVVWGKNRKEAITKLHASLLHYNIAGLETNINFLLDLVNHPEFQRGNVHTNFIRDHQSSLFKDDVLEVDDLFRASLAVVLFDKRLERDVAKRKNDVYNPFIIESNFRVNYRHIRDLKFKFNKKEHITKIKFSNSSFEDYEVSSDNGVTWKKVNASMEFVCNKNILYSTIDGHASQTNVFKGHNTVVLFTQRGKLELTLIPNESLFDLDDVAESPTGSVNKAIAPMPGILDKIFVKIGDKVKKGDSLFVLIAMKMEHIVKATRDGEIIGIPFKAGDSIPKDAVVVQFSDEEINKEE